MIKYFVIVFFVVCGSVTAYSQIYHFPISHRIVMDGSGGLDESEIPLIMKELNRAFAPAGIKFYKITRSN